jgi:hypothetical protein
VLVFEQFFSYVSFFPCGNNTHIFSLAHVVNLAFDHFAFELTYVKLAIQLCKCLGWAPFNLPFGFTFAFIFVALSITLGSCVTFLVLVSFHHYFCKKFLMKMFTMLMHF